jgi:spore coat protein U-like protein
MKAGKLRGFDLRLLTVALACVFAAGGAGVGVEAYAASSTSTATATVVAPIAISQTAALNFGRFSTPAGGSAGTVTIQASAAGTRSSTGGTVLVTSVAGNSGVYAVTGEGALTYAITNPTATTLTGDGAAMAVTFTTSPSGTGALTAGAQTLYVGGTLTVGAVQTAGAYTGSYTVTVEYN